MEGHVVLVVKVKKANVSDDAHDFEMVRPHVKENNYEHVKRYKSLEALS